LLYKVTAGLEEAILLLKARDWTKQPPEVPSRQNSCASNTNSVEDF